MQKGISILLLVFGLLYTINSCTDDDCCEYITYEFHNSCKNDSVNFDIKFILSGYNVDGAINYPVGDSLIYDSASNRYYYPEGTVSVSYPITPIVFVTRNHNTPDSSWGTDTLAYQLKKGSLNAGDHIEFNITLEGSILKPE